MNTLVHYILHGEGERLNLGAIFEIVFHGFNIVYFYIRPLLEVESYVKQRMRTVFLDMSNPKVMQ
jgi:hypothetical protein